MLSRSSEQDGWRSTAEVDARADAWFSNMEAAPEWAWPPVDQWDVSADEPPRVWVPKSRARRVAGDLLTTCWMLPLTVLTVVAIGMLVAKVFFGLTPLSVRSGSMEPTIPTYALAFVESVPTAEVEKNDVITFDPPGTHGRVTHRVVKTYTLDGRRFFETQGDANPAVDDWRGSPGVPVKPAPGQGAPKVTQTRGIAYDGESAVRYVFHVPWLGRLGVWLERPDVRGVVIYLPFVCIALWLLAMIWVRPRATAREPAGEWVPLHDLPWFGLTPPPARLAPAVVVAGQVRPAHAPLLAEDVVPDASLRAA